MLSWSAWVLHFPCLNTKLVVNLVPTKLTESVVASHNESTLVLP